MNSYSVQLALAALEMLHERKTPCRRAAREAATHAARSKDRASNSQFA